MSAPLFSPRRARTSIGIRKARPRQESGKSVEMYLTEDEALEDIRRRTPPDKKVVFVSGNFNILHPGHFRLFHFAADCGDFLVVGVNPPSTPGAIIPQKLRLEAVQHVSCIDRAFMLSSDATEFIAKLKPHVVVKGKEYEHKDNPEFPVVESYGGKILFNSGDAVFSSHELIRDEFKEIWRSHIEKPRDFLNRHNFSQDDAKNTIRRFGDLNVLVIGDLVIDEYVHCEALGLSQEDATVVVAPIVQERFVGGAGIVSGHAAGLGARVSFVSVTGRDETAAFAAAKLGNSGVDATLLVDDTRPTTLKQRYRTATKTLLRVSQLKQHSIHADLQAQALREVERRLEDLDLIIFSDFNYGCLPQRLVDEIARRAKERGILMVADSQSSSQVGDISRFLGMAMVKATEHEARLSLRDFESGLVVLADKLGEKAEARNVVLTLGAEGLLIRALDANEGEEHTDRLGALNHSPRDVAGAGDSFLVASGLSLATGADIWQSSYIGSIAAACQVGRVGNIPLAAADLFNAIDL
jgi:rfaE bifunctional protein kinase chain/domain